MNRLFSASFFFVLASLSIVCSQQLASAQKPTIEFVKPNEVQENNTIHWEIKVKAEGTTLNRVVLDILPKGGKKAVFGDPEPLPSGRGHHRPFHMPVVEGGVFQEEGKAKKLPPGPYYMVVIVHYNGNKTTWSHHFPSLTGKAQRGFEGDFVVRSAH